MGVYLNFKMPGRKRKQQDSTDDGAAATSKVPDEPAKAPAKMTVAELKKELQDRGLDTSGKKAELVTRLEGAKSGTQKKSTDTTDSGKLPKPKKQKTEPGIH